MGVRVEEVRKFLADNPEGVPDRQAIEAQVEMAALQTDGYLATSQVTQIFGSEVAAQIELGAEAEAEAESS